MQECRIDDCLNIDGSRDLSDSWTGLTQFYLSRETSRRISLVRGKTASMIIGILMDQEICLILAQVSPSFIYHEKPPDGYMWSGERLTKRQATSRPDHLWPQLWTKLAELREKQKWPIEKPKLDNARRLRGINFIVCEIMVFKKIIEKARRKLENPLNPTMSCKTCNKNNHGEFRSRTMISSLNMYVSWKLVNRQKSVWKNLYRNSMRGEQIHLTRHFSHALLHTIRCASTLHGSRRATPMCLCSANSYRLHAIHNVCLIVC